MLYLIILEKKCIFERSFSEKDMEKLYMRVKIWDHDSVMEFSNQTYLSSTITKYSIHVTVKLLPVLYLSLYLLCYVFSASDFFSFSSLSWR